jgi:hypothetical protein
MHWNVPVEMNASEKWVAKCSAHSGSARLASMLVDERLDELNDLGLLTTR